MNFKKIDDVLNKIIFRLFVYYIRLGYFILGSGCWVLALQGQDPPQGRIKYTQLSQLLQI